MSTFVKVKVAADIDLTKMNFVNHKSNTRSLVGSIYNSDKFDHENGSLFNTQNIESFKVVNNVVYAETKYSVYRLRNVSTSKLAIINKDENLFIHHTPKGSEYDDLLVQVFSE